MSISGETITLDIIGIILISIQIYLSVHYFIGQEVVLGILWAGLATAHLVTLIINHWSKYKNDREITNKQNH